MTEAFSVLKTHRVKYAVLITDGLPDDKAKALREAKGLRLDIFYVGPSLAPWFLEQLARSCGGQFRAADLRETKLLTQAVKGLLIRTVYLNRCLFRLRLRLWLQRRLWKVFVQTEEDYQLQSEKQRKRG